MNGVELTLLHAERAADAARLADILDCLALLLRHTSHVILCLVGRHLDDVTRAGLHTEAAGHTLLLVDHGNAVHHMDGIELADLHAGAAAEAAELTAEVTAAGHDRHLVTVGRAHVFGALNRLVTGTGAANHCDLLDRLARLNPHDVRNLLGDGLAADRTLGDSRLADCNRMRTAVAARETAGAAVVAGQCLADRKLLLIHFYFELLTCNAETHAANQSDDTDNRKRDNDNCIIHLSPSAQLIMPEKPVNAIAMSPEIINTMGRPRKYFGMSLPSHLSRMPARMTMAMA